MQSRENPPRPPAATSACPYAQAIHRAGPPAPLRLRRALTAACAHLFRSGTRGSRKKTPGTAAFLSGKPRAGPGAKIIRGREQRKEERKAADCRPMRRQGGAGVR